MGSAVILFMRASAVWHSGLKANASGRFKGLMSCAAATSKNCKEKNDTKIKDTRNLGIWFIIFLLMLG
jgi:hypothetical protein